MQAEVDRPVLVKKPIKKTNAKTNILARANAIVNAAFEKAPVAVLA